MGSCPTLFGFISNAAADCNDQIVLLTGCTHARGIPFMCEGAMCSLGHFGTNLWAGFYLANAPKKSVRGYWAQNYYTFGLIVITPGRNIFGTDLVCDPWSPKFQNSNPNNCDCTICEVDKIEATPAKLCAIQ